VVRHSPFSQSAFCTSVCQLCTRMMWCSFSTLSIAFLRCSDEACLFSWVNLSCDFHFYQNAGPAQDILFSLLHTGLWNLECLGIRLGIDSSSLCQPSPCCVSHGVHLFCLCIPVGSKRYEMRLGATTSDLCCLEMFHCSRIHRKELYSNMFTWQIPNE